MYYLYINNKYVFILKIYTIYFIKIIIFLVSKYLILVVIIQSKNK